MVLVDCLLDRQQQVCRPLALVDDGPVQAPDEASQIGLAALSTV